MFDNLISSAYEILRAKFLQARSDRDRDEIIVDETEVLNP